MRLISVISTDKAYMEEKGMYTGYAARTKKKNGYFAELGKCFKANWQIYIMILPALVFYTLFCYEPMYGAIIAFKDYSPRAGILGSDWVGFKHFIDFFTGPYFSRTLINTLWISLCTLCFSFPAPIMLAVMINELKSKSYSRVVQTASYLPHFISMVVICSLIKEFTSQSGVITEFLRIFGFPNVSMLNEPGLFVPIYVISDIWQCIGWDSIIYLAALTSISPDLYEAASIDGVGRFQKIIYITIPGIMPTVVTMLILRIGGLMSVGYEKIILLQSASNYSTSDVINSFVYRRGLVDRSYSFSSAVGLFNSVINCVLLFGSNWFSRKFSSTSLW